MEKGLTATEYRRLIRKHCIDCCGGSRELVEQCKCKDCVLHPHRMGDTEKEVKKDEK